MFKTTKLTTAGYGKGHQIHVGGGKYFAFFPGKGLYQYKPGPDPVLNFLKRDLPDLDAALSHIQKLTSKA